MLFRHTQEAALNTPYPANICMQDLHVMAVLFRERNMSRAAERLGASQPALSKVLARLRAQFGDRLFVWSGRSMQPTRRALELLEPLQDTLAAFDLMNRTTGPFAPENSRREFRLLLTDVGMIVFLPRLMEQIRVAGPQLGLNAMPFDARDFTDLLEAGGADLAIGDMPNAAAGLRRQTLYTDHYLSVARAAHPQLAALGQANAFLAAQHILVQASYAGHSAHGTLARVLAAAVSPGQLQLRLPSFMASAAVAAQTDAVATMPSRLARFLEQPLGLSAFRPPVELPPIEIAQIWHERMHADPEHRWLRTLIFSLFHA